MFNSKDLQVLQQPGSWEKLAAIQETFFPKLGALQIEANKLIYEIYKIDVNSRYKISQTPTFSSRKGQIYSAERQDNSNYVLVGLRAKGKPSHLTRPNGKLSQLHFALLAFCIDIFDDEYELSCHFSPNIARYSAKHLLDFSKGIVLHDLDRTILQVADWYRVSQELHFFDLFQKHRAWLSVNVLKLSEIKQKSLANLVVSYAACFPLLDLFTRISNGETVYLNNQEDLYPVNNPNYVELFENWQSENVQNYIEKFSVKPICQEDVWKSEALTRSIFEDLFDEKFPKTRPVWLKSSRSKASLELDGYCEKWKIAFEYQGEYHYMEIPIHHQNRSLKEIQKNDELKMSLCQKNGINLIQIPYWEKGSRDYIIKTLVSLSRPDIQKILGF